MSPSSSNGLRLALRSAGRDARRVPAARRPSDRGSRQPGPGPRPSELQRPGTTFALGDVTVEFDGRPVLDGAPELDQVVLAYATTVHKAQGCEYPAVVIPVTTQHYSMLQRNLICTGITRGRKLVVPVGQEKALEMAVRGSRTVRRWSTLGEWLADQPASGLTTRASP